MVLRWDKMVGRGAYGWDGTVAGAIQPIGQWGIRWDEIAKPRGILWCLGGMPICSMWKYAKPRGILWCLRSL